MALIESKLVRWILILMFVIIVILLFLKVTFDRGDEQSQKQICKESVYLNHILQSSVNELSSSIKCPTKDVMIDDVKEANAIIAKEMADCWDNFGEGKLNLFKDEGIFCVVCSNIEFEEKSKSVAGFKEYLLTHHLPNDPTLTYSDYLSGIGYARSQEVIDELKANGNYDLIANEAISTGSLYSTMLIYAKGKDATGQFIKKFTYGYATFAGVNTGYAVMQLSNVLLVLPVPGTRIIAFTAKSIGAAVSLGSMIFGSYATYLADVEPEWISMILLREHTSAELEDLGCEYFPSKQN